MDYLWSPQNDVLLYTINLGLVLGQPFRTQIYIEFSQLEYI